MWPSFLPHITLHILAIYRIFTRHLPGQTLTKADGINFGFLKTLHELSST